jgi:hypothetical protein
VPWSSSTLSPVAGEKLLPRKRTSLTTIAIVMSCAWPVLAGCQAAAQPEILGIAPASGPEGTRVEINGKNLVEVSAVLFGTTQAVFHAASPLKLVAIVPHRVSTSRVSVIAPRGRSSGPSPFVVSNDPRIPDEVSYKAGYVNPAPRPAGFGSARLWGIAIADTRVPATNRRK